jgi:hypothetical protein
MLEVHLFGQGPESEEFVGFLGLKGKRKRSPTQTSGIFDEIGMKKRTLNIERPTSNRKRQRNRNLRMVCKIWMIL